MERRMAEVTYEKLSPVIYTPIETAVALSLYAYNVSPMVRAERLYNGFAGNCAELSDLLHTLVYSPAYVATELAPPTASLYVRQALEEYGESRLHLPSYSGQGWLVKQYRLLDADWLSVLPLILHLLGC